jgi:hypothetical protein
MSEIFTTKMAAAIRRIKGRKDSPSTVPMRKAIAEIAGNRKKIGIQYPFGKLQETPFFNKLITPSLPSPSPASKKAPTKGLKRLTKREVFNSISRNHQNQQNVMKKKSCTSHWI